MKLTGILLALFAFFLILSFGIGTIFRPAESTNDNRIVASQDQVISDDLPANATTTKALTDTSSNQATYSASTTSGNTASNAKQDQLLIERTQKYQEAITEWHALNDERERAMTELESVRVQIAGNEAIKLHPPEFETREWSTIDEKYKTTAVLLNTDNETVTLRKSDGKTINVEKNKLIAENRIYVENAFNRLTKYREACDTLKQSNQELDDRVKALMIKIAAANKPMPKKPTLEDIAAEEAKEKEKLLREQLEKEQAAALAARYKMGDTVTVGYTSYAIWSAKWVQTISENPFLNAKPDASFLLVNVTVRNNDTKARNIPLFKLVDENGYEYETSSKSIGIRDAIGPLASLNPGVSKQGDILFDVPKKNTYKLQLDGGFWSTKTKTVDLTID